MSLSYLPCVNISTTVNMGITGCDSCPAGSSCDGETKTQCGAGNYSSVEHPVVYHVLQVILSSFFKKNFLTYMYLKVTAGFSVGARFQCF